MSRISTILLHENPIPLHRGGVSKTEGWVGGNKVDGLWEQNGPEVVLEVYRG